MESAPGLRVATRSSPLAVAQTREALARLRAAFPDPVAFTLLELESPGDRDPNTPLDAPGVPEDFFTRDLDQALRERRADLAIHSAKDLPSRLAEGLTLAALLPAADIRDALVMAPGRDSDRDPPRTIGTSSPRRLEAVRSLFPDARAVPIRGTIGRRIDQVDSGAVDAVIVAACALHRLGLEHRQTRLLPIDPTPQQGRLAVVVAAHRSDLVEALRPLDVRSQMGQVILSREPGPTGDSDPDTRRRLLQAAEAGREVVWSRPGPGPLLPRDLDPWLGFFHDWQVPLRIRLDPGPVLATTMRADTALRLAPVVHLPVLETAPRPARDLREELDARGAGCVGVLFPSVPAVEAVSAAGFPAGRPDLRVLALGPATAAAARAAGWRVEAEGPGVQGLDVFVQGLDQTVQSLDGSWLYPCSDQAPLPEREATAAKAGMRLVPVVAYQTRPRSGLTLPGDPFPAVLFGSASGVSAYFAAFPAESGADRLWIGLGPPTVEALVRRGLPGVPMDMVIR